MVRMLPADQQTTATVIASAPTGEAENPDPLTSSTTPVSPQNIPAVSLAVGRFPNGRLISAIKAGSKATNAAARPDATLRSATAVPPAPPPSSRVPTTRADPPSPRGGI